jgi:hypothetical protein
MKRAAMCSASIGSAEYHWNRVALAVMFGGSELHNWVKRCGDKIRELELYYRPQPHERSAIGKS